MEAAGSAFGVARAILAPGDDATPGHAAGDSR
jgi:hypothetical protein